MIKVISRPFLGKEKYKDFRLCYINSPFCVRDISAGTVAWIFARGLRSKCIDGIAIQAGVNPYEFFERVDRINEMYPYEPEEEY